MRKRKSGIVLVILVINWIFTLVPLCISKTGDDPEAIRKLFRTFERGYEGRDVEEYISVFSDEEYEYISDVTTPDDPSDDIHLLGAESERRAAIRIFKTYEYIDLEMTDPEITINGDSAEVKNEIKLAIVAFEKANVPSIYYAVSLNSFSVQKIKGGWKITRWQQHELSAEELAARKQEERKDKKVEDLIRDLGNDRPGIWAAAMLDLKRESGTAIGSLVSTLRNPDKNVRTRTARILYGTRDENAVRALIEILEDEKDDVDVRVAAANALSESDDPAVENALIRVAKGSKPKLKSAASLVLARRIRKKIDDTYQIAMTGLQHEDDVVREAAAESLGIMMSIRGANLLEDRFRDRGESENVRLAALESLSQLGLESFLPVFRDTLKDETETTRIRAYAARSLGEAKDPEALGLLIDMAKDEKEDFELRKEAIIALGAIGNSKAMKPLTGLLKSPDVDIRREAIRSLERLEDRRALKPLMTALMNRDEDIFVRRLAGGGIVKIDRDIAFGPLSQIMNDEIESAPARRMATEILVSSGYEQSIPLFVEILKDKKQPWWFRRVVADHLGSFRNSAAGIEALKSAAGDPDERIAKTARDALKNTGYKLSISP